MKSLRQPFVVGFTALAFGFLGAAIAVRLFAENIGVVENKSSNNVYLEESLLAASVDKIKGAVVSINNDKNGGTGFMVSSDGLIITNKHLAGSKKGQSFEVTFDDGGVWQAQLVDSDPFEDVAFLQIKGMSDSIHFTTARLGDSDDLKVGQRVFAIGNALSLYGNTVTYGIVSAKERQVSAYDDFKDGPSNFYGLIQTDAAINLGNSGGPLVNLNGEVIGMNVAVVENGNDIGFAMPVNDLKPLIESVKKYREIRRPMLGVSFLMLDEYEGKEFGVDHGALLVTDDQFNDPAVLKGGPADKAGLKKFDVILAVDGVDVNAQNPLNRLIRKYQPGDTVKLKVLSGTEEKEVELVLGDVAE